MIEQNRETKYFIAGRRNSQAYTGMVPYNGPAPRGFAGDIGAVMQREGALTEHARGGASNNLQGTLNPPAVKVPELALSAVHRLLDLIISNQAFSTHVRALAEACRK